MSMVSNRGIKVASRAESAQMIRDALANKEGPARDIVGFNAGLAIYAGNRAASIQDGMKQAFELLANGAARAKLDEFCTYTRKQT
jgi:anthranilate phosphoribosyltransferase